MKKNFKLATFFVIVLFAVSCEKNKSNDIINQPLDEDKFVNMTLEEFIQSVETDDEKSFFKKHSITDNSNIGSNILNSQTLYKTKGINSGAEIIGVGEAERKKIKFKWGAGCKKPIGICIIIPIPGAINQATYLYEYDDGGNASVITLPGKYVIIPDTDDNGITSDGYLPIYSDLYIDSITMVKSGIYKANYDTQQKKYTAITLDTY